MERSIYFINPIPRSLGIHSNQIFGHYSYHPVALIADLTLPTLAAMVPADFQVSICDQLITPINYESSAHFIAITVKAIDMEIIKALSSEFRKRNKIIIMGGPMATLEPETLRPHCDILVKGEMENIYQDFFNDLIRGTWKDEYDGGRPELQAPLLPRWDLYPNHRALIGSVQTSRGCPFQCEFCDVIVYLGRKMRHKSIDNILRELDALYAIGYRKIYLADDNFTATRRKARLLLDAIVEWNERRSGGKVYFITLLTIDAANDLDLLKKCSEAGIKEVFIGIETPNQESLKETKKYQNTLADVFQQVHHFLDCGIMVKSGMMVGFDNDHLDIFQHQFNFAQEIPIPLFYIAPLIAPIGTPLFRRMQAENRLVLRKLALESAWTTNIIPKNMSRRELLIGIRWLANRLYQPDNFERRVMNLIDHFSPDLEYSHHHSEVREIDKEARKILLKFMTKNSSESLMFAKVFGAIANKPAMAPIIASILFGYVNLRDWFSFNNIWDESVGNKDFLTYLTEQQGDGLYPLYD